MKWEIFKFNLPDSFSGELSIPESDDKADDKPKLTLWAHGVHSGIAGDITLANLGEIIRHFCSWEDVWAANSELENRVDCAINTDSNETPTKKKRAKKRHLKSRKGGVI